MVAMIDGAVACQLVDGTVLLHLKLLFENQLEEKEFRYERISSTNQINISNYKCGSCCRQLNNRIKKRRFICRTIQNGVIN